MSGTLSEPSFAGIVGRTVRESVPTWPRRPTPASDAPNVVVVVLDDVGFAQLGAYGSDIATPAIDALADDGVRFSNFHVTPLCSPTRACLLTGRNHHSVGMGTIAGFPSGFPNGREAVTHRAAMLPALLKATGYGTYGVGKWHLVPNHDITPAGRFDHWPLAHGFDRYYGFLAGETDQYRPNLIRDNQVITPPTQEDYHLSVDLVDQAIGMLADHRTGAPTRPFFLYLAFGACHGPHQVPRAFRERYAGRYDAGWDAVRRAWFERQRRLGLIPADAELVDRNPDVPAWDSFDPTDRALLARYHEVFAGFLEHTDTQVGRLVAALEHLDCRDNTVVMVLSDNGATGEGGEHGAWNELIALNAVAHSIDDDRAHLDALGDRTTYPLYPAGWGQVGNTPFKWYKHHTFAGGVRAPLIVNWPRGMAAPGRIDHEFHHAIDLTPTVLELCDVSPSDQLAGVPQLPLHGTSMAATLRADGTAARPRTQYFEMLGHRGIYHDGWKATTFHEPGADFQTETWELYHVDQDFSEVHDLAAEHPAKLQELRELWWHEAGRFGVTPLDDRFLERALEKRGSDYGDVHHRTYYRGAARIHENATSEVRSGHFRMTVELEALSPQHRGVIACFGGAFAGFVWIVDHGTQRFEYNRFGRISCVEAAISPIGVDVRLAVELQPEGAGAAVSLLVDDAVVGTGSVPELVPYYLGGNGFEVGANRLSPVSPSYEMPFEFDGVFHRVVVDTYTIATAAEPPTDAVLGAE